jgi:hypothetical protein
MFTIKRNKKDEVILDITLNPIPALITFFSSLDTFFSSKIFYTIPMGLGLGFGLALIVFSQPMQITADTSNNEAIHETTKPIKITLPEKNYTSTLEEQNNFSLVPLQWKSRTIWYPFFPQAQSGLIVIGIRNTQANNFFLGEEVRLTGANNGVYQYSIYEIRSIVTKDIQSIIKNNTAKVIILHPTNIIGSEYLLALAK